MKLSSLILCTTQCFMSILAMFLSFPLSRMIFKVIYATLASNSRAGWHPISFKNTFYCVPVRLIMNISSSITAFVLLFLFRLAESICYYPDGTVAPQDTPCDDDSSESTCCGQGYACLSNHICQATGEERHKNGATEFVRGSCTDKNWRSGSCPAFCVNPEAPSFDLTAGGMGMAKCANITEDIYYCINQNTDHVDCEKKVNVVTFQGTPTALTTIGARTSANTFTSDHTSTYETTDSSTAALRSTTASFTSAYLSGLPITTSSDPAATLPATQSSNSTTKTGEIVGGVIGGLGVISITMTSLWLYARKKKQATGQERPIVELSTELPQTHHAGAYKKDAHRIAYHELEDSGHRQIHHDSHPRVYEMQS
ncbi:hypothetical protein F5Y18DRAFT_371754 [Xylariaceae sp. FL1019]|nr:hypothetical protein F5Y18DRAFT_371754 [Xylariaceae sp. FL1019]